MSRSSPHMNNLILDGQIIGGVATSSQAGIVKPDGATITISGDTISAITTIIPTATSSQLGGVKIPTGQSILQVDGSSNLRVVPAQILTSTLNNDAGWNNYTLPTATSSALGGVKVDGTSIVITGGVISSTTGAGSYTLPAATTGALGGVKVPSGNLSVDGSGVLSFTQSPTFTGTVTAAIADINGGTVDGASVGASVASTGVFTALTVGSNTANTSISALLNSAAGQTREVGFKTGGVYRWSIAVDSAPETGSNNGSAFSISRFSDVGGYIDSPFYVNRLSGYASMDNLQVQNSLNLYGQTFQNIRKITSGSSYTLIGTDSYVQVNKTSGSATGIVIPGPNTGLEVLIQDTKGDAVTNHITITTAAGLINGAANYVISTAYGFCRLTNDGTNWFVTGK